MKISFISKTDSSRLLLIYAGWSIEASFFQGLQCPGYDIAIVYDYSTLTPPCVPNYEEVVLIAWSLGVHAAEITAAKLPLTLTIAVNGTPTPVNDTFGIPKSIFEATAANLNEKSLAKFHRRMGLDKTPKHTRNISDLKAELINFPLYEVPDFRWDRAIIASDDHIFPPQNQRMAWINRAEIHEISAGHTPDFQKIIQKFIINKSLVSKRFMKGMKTYVSESEVQKLIAEKLFFLWKKNSPIYGNILEFGVGTGYFTKLYQTFAKNLTLWDISPTFPNAIKADAEVEIIHVHTKFDAIVSASTMQWFNSPGAFLNRCIKALNPGAVIAISTFGPQTFNELKHAGVIPLPYLSEDSLKRIIPPEFEILELQSEKILKNFSSPIELLRHMKATGVNTRPCSSGIYELMRRLPREVNGSYTLTYQPIYLILKLK